MRRGDHGRPGVEDEAVVAIDGTPGRRADRRARRPSPGTPRSAGGWRRPGRRSPLPTTAARLPGAMRPLQVLALEPCEFGVHVVPPGACADRRPQRGARPLELRVGTRRGRPYPAGSGCARRAARQGRPLAARPARRAAARRSARSRSRASRPTPRSRARGAGPRSPCTRRRGFRSPLRSSSICSADRRFRARTRRWRRAGRPAHPRRWRRAPSRGRAGCRS